MKTKWIRPPKVNIITLGCSKNVVDSEVMLAQLHANNFDAAHEKQNGKDEIVIINTCGFIERAKQESINTILEYAHRKKEGYVNKLYVTGCLSQRYRDELKIEIPEVDDWFGTMELPNLLQRLGADYKHELIGERKLITPSHSAFLKISEGCNRTCSFCAIPLMRGKHISKPLAQIVAEAKILVKNGVKEIMLIAQELTYYGLDLYKERRLKDLLELLSDIPNLEWIRLHYAYPGKFPVDILDPMRERENICSYLDIPLQHISDSVLTGMRRQISKKEIHDLIITIRKKVPGIALRTTLLVGFPGETEEDFEELIDFIEEIKFERAGVFMYSHENGTPGFTLRDDVPEEIKQERASVLMNVQEEISFELNRQKTGKSFKVLIDRKEGKYYCGRTEHDAPEVDNEVLIDATQNYLRIGDFSNVMITSAESYDLFGEPVVSA